MAKFATVRDLKNQTTALIREAEKGRAVVVTRRGKPVATLKPFEQKDLEKQPRYPTSAFDALKKKILAAAETGERNPRNKRAGDLTKSTRR
jgi:prevent-host-death family protein